MKYFSYLLFFLLIILISFCDDEPTKVKTGIIYVSVVDENNSLVPNEKIIVTPDSLVKYTDANGICKYEVEPGDYYVNAHLPGPGPAGYYYHKLVMVKSNETIKVKLLACLSCM